MHGADEIIPRMPRGELANPVALSGKKIHFQSHPDRELRKGFLCQPHFGDVFTELPVEHPPVVEIVARQRRVVGETNFRQTELDGVARVIHRFARRVPAEGRVHMVIGWQLHDTSKKENAGR